MAAPAPRLKAFTMCPGLLMPPSAKIGTPYKLLIQRARVRCVREREREREQTTMSCLHLWLSLQSAKCIPLYQMQSEPSRNSKEPMGRGWRSWPVTRLITTGEDFAPRIASLATLYTADACARPQAQTSWAALGWCVCVRRQKTWKGTTPTESQKWRCWQSLRWIFRFHHRLEVSCFFNTWSHPLIGSWVVQIDPIPMPTRKASAPHSIKFLACCLVTTLPATTSMLGCSFLIHLAWWSPNTVAFTNDTKCHRIHHFQTGWFAFSSPLELVHHPISVTGPCALAGITWSSRAERHCLPGCCRWWWHRHQQRPKLQHVPCLLVECQ